MGQWWYVTAINPIFVCLKHRISLCSVGYDSLRKTRCRSKRRYPNAWKKKTSSYKRILVNILSFIAFRQIYLGLKHHICPSNVNNGKGAPPQLRQTPHQHVPHQFQTPTSSPPFSSSPSSAPRSLFLLNTSIAIPQYAMGLISKTLNTIVLGGVGTAGGFAFW